MKLLTSATLIAAAARSAPPPQAQDIAAGERSWNKCRACHQIGETAKNGVGPQLNGLFGRHSGAVEGYSYSRRQQELRHHLGRGRLRRVHQGSARQDPGHQDGLRRHQERARRSRI